VLKIKIESWAAFTPGMEYWEPHPQVITEPISKKYLMLIPPLLRRRLGFLGKHAVAAALQILPEGESIPSIFASRYGDTDLTLSLLKGIGQGEAMSPTDFSLAVHNAVSGLFSIARKDHAAVISIAAMEALVLQTLFEAIGQLDSVERVLCVIYDIPLPDIDRHYASKDSIPYAIAAVLSRKNGKEYIIEQCSLGTQNNQPSESFLETEPFKFIDLLIGKTNEIESEVNGTVWRIKMMGS
jgi:hypothetical protein